MRLLNSKSLMGAFAIVASVGVAACGSSTNTTTTKSTASTPAAATPEHLGDLVY